jgi:hypothetical protein
MGTDLISYKLRRVALEQTRAYIVNSTFQIYQATGQEDAVTAKFLHSNDCCVTDSIIAIIQQLYTVCNNNNNSNNKSSSSSSSDTLNDICTVYISLFQSFWKRQLKTSPLISLLFHNDCLLLSQQLATLSLQLRRRGTVEESQMANALTKHAMDLRSLAKSTVENLLETQKQMILEMLHNKLDTPADEEIGLDLDTQSDVGTLQTMKRQFKYSLTRIAKIVKQVASAKFCVKFLGLLVDVFARKMVETLIFIQGQDISLQVASVLYSLMDFLLEFIEYPASLDYCNNDNDDLKLSGRITHHNSVAMFQRIVCLKRILHPAQNLSAMNQQLQNGEYTDVFSAAELRQLVTSL